MDTAPITLMGPDLTCSDHTLDVFFGDPIVSFRQCLKRYNFLHNIQFSNAQNYTQWVLSNFPMYYGNAPGAVHNQGTGPAINYAKLTLLNYVTPAFTCRRGGLRWKYMLTGHHNDFNQACGIMSLERDPTTSSTYSQISIDSPRIWSGPISDRVYGSLATGSNGWSGVHVVPTNLNPVVECELPFYSEERFIPGKKANVTSTGTRNFFHKLLCYAGKDNDSESDLSVRAYVSTGEDFTLGFFTGCPVAYYQPVPPP
jgi:hypothetical protein